MVNLNKQVPSHIIEKFKSKESAQKRIGELEKQKRQILNGYQNTFTKEWVIHYI